MRIFPSDLFLFLSPFFLFLFIEMGHLNNGVVVWCMYTCFEEKMYVMDFGEKGGLLTVCTSYSLD